MVFVFLTGWWSILAQFMSSAAALVLALFVARIVSKNDYGDYQYVISLISTLSIFSLSGLGGAVLQSVARGFDQSLPDGFWLNLKWSFGVALAAVCVSGYYFYGNELLGSDHSHRRPHCPADFKPELVRLILQRKKDVKRSSLYPNGIGNVIPIIGIISGALISANAAGLVLGYVITINLLTSRPFGAASRSIRSTPAG